MNSVENMPGQLPGGVGKSGGIDPLVEDLAYRKFDEELVDTVMTFSPNTKNSVINMHNSPHKLHTVPGNTFVNKKLQE